MGYVFYYITFYLLQYFTLHYGDFSHANYVFSPLTSDCCCILTHVSIVNLVYRALQYMSLVCNSLVIQFNVQGILCHIVFFEDYNIFIYFFSSITHYFHRIRLNSSLVLYWSLYIIL